jgi:hypothetical protein
VELSNWMLLATFSISLIIGFGKRRHELDILGHQAGSHRINLFDYKKELIDMMIGISTAITAISYALYAMDDDTLQKLGTANLIYTFPFVLFGIYRYLQLIFNRGKGGNPEEMVLKDKGIVISVVLWLVIVIFLLYFKKIHINLDFNLFHFIKTR